jgi:hypothetical protein
MSLTLDGTNGISASGGVNVLQNDSVVTGNLVNSAVTTAKIANDAVTEAKIANSAVTDAKIANSAVTDAKISAVAATKLTGTVPTARLASGTANNTTFLRGDQTWQTISTTPTTAQVLNATAGANAAVVGVYATVIKSTSGNIAQDGTVAGSALSGSPPGTWRNMGIGTMLGSGGNVVLALRIS